MPRLRNIGALTFAQLRKPRAAAALASFAIAAGIVGNALFMQAGPHPAPFFLTRLRQAAQPARPDELVRAVQDALMQVGYYSGPLDGIAGPQTQSAIKAFEARTGHDETGVASSELFAAIRSSDRVDLAPVPTRVATTSNVSPSILDAGAEPAAPDGVVAAVQDALARSAYGPLTVDGVAGPETREAIMRFQKDHKLPVTGEVSDALVVELKAIGAMGGG